ncbi:hypothetical protein ASPWEDRAFT_36623 [Aspergillus wentii DTO 134E9]|uniref:TATA element modulatory factor 1 TATA binding domain-containing protein n=1 Tax=Aspergillus wentii DTO 134E9 TaxID=1073089 RepID=A0A1L9RVH2_ASPWE|nr:uncharacterized protein ASPWEDRAFT_36623 [Aspergillus wentii DTO 134E9]KAI9928824.1 hypothetical protein MW887_002045 [Aspergillus wentii]OJJ38925.1 hypothetical protein ASPWEDRAFT_36623 [Aspergillus wentii DTO 134E9]
MAQNSQGSKPKWKVGSFLQQAVAGVESRLDLILSEEDEKNQQQAKAAAAARAKQAESPGNQTGASNSKPTSGTVSRNSSNARKNDRLQERLARAMVNKSNATGNTASQPSSAQASSPPSPVPSNDARSSLDVESNGGSSRRNTQELSRDSVYLEEDPSTIPRASHDSGISSRNSKEIAKEDDTPPQDTTVEDKTDRAHEDESSIKSETDEPESSRASKDLTQTTVDVSPEDPQSESNDREEVAKLKANHKVAESNWQEETHGYIERIDALQSKLKYLAKEAAESAKNAARTADPGSTEKQLREKDEKIALLLEEGQKLSKSEMDHRTALKKLRQQLIENTRTQTEDKKKTDKLEKDIASLEARVKRAEAAEKRANESLSSQTKVSRDLDAVTSERNALSQTVSEMKAQLARAVSRAEAAEAKAQSDALEQEKQRTTQLEEELSSSKVEHDLSEENLRREVGDLQQSIEQEKEKSRMLEAELKNEQSVLESKMESLRSRAEEASSGATGDAQAKLLRQIETLQTQYAVASENWQTLEGSLLSRLATVEKERDDVARREGDMRRKIREVNLKAKKAEEELETARETEHDLQSKLEECMQELQKTEQRLKKASDDLVSAQKDLVEQKKASDAVWTQKLEEERAKWREQMLPPAGFLQQSRTESPVALNRRNLDTAGSFSDYRPTSRRSSVLPTSPDIGTPPRQNSFTQGTLSPPAANGVMNTSMMEPPSIAFEQDDFLSRSGTPFAPSVYGANQTHHSRGINDIISESTVGAGPSVQLVERMSATVRRLESERAASKDELARITSQRDEARNQVVDLMRETEENKSSGARVHELESRIEELDQRYQTTLEMLGEKSEQVEELEADIADLKRIYRELVDSTMK